MSTVTALPDRRRPWPGAPPPRTGVAYLPFTAQPAKPQ
jgi:hypothetical protein